MIKNVTLCILSFQGLSSLRNYPFVYIDILGFKIVIFFMILLLKKNQHFESKNNINKANLF